MRYFFLCLLLAGFATHALAQDAPVTPPAARKPAASPPCEPGANSIQLMGLDMDEQRCREALEIEELHEAEDIATGLRAKLTLSEKRLAQARQEVKQAKAATDANAHLLEYYKPYADGADKQLSDLRGQLEAALADAGKSKQLISTWYEPYVTGADGQIDDLRRQLMKSATQPR